MASAASSSAAGAGKKPYQLFPPSLRADLPSGKPNIPIRPVGDVGPERPCEYPTAWPAHIQRAIDRRGAGPVRIYVDGIWDLTHCGHFRAMEQAKKSLPNVYLMVGCCNDELTHRLKGSTVLTDAERYEAVRACRWVDQVIADAPWVVTDEFIDKHDIDFVAHDALPYVDTSGQSASGDVYAHLKEAGRFLETQRTEGVSTSDLIIRIVKRYDDFVRRNLKRGFSAKDMNVPFLKEKALRLEMALQSQAGKAKAQMVRLSEAAEHVQYSFLRLFSHEGADMVKSTLRGLKDGLTSAIGMRSPRGSLRSAASVAGSVGSLADEEDGREAGGASAGAGAGASSSSAAAGAGSSKKRGGRLAAPKPRKAADAASASSAGAAALSEDEAEGEGESDGEHAEAASLQRTAAFVLEHTLGARLRRARADSAGDDDDDDDDDDADADAASGSAAAGSATSSGRRHGGASARAGAGAGVGQKRKASSAASASAADPASGDESPGKDENEEAASGSGSDAGDHGASAAGSAHAGRGSSGGKGKGHAKGRAAASSRSSSGASGAGAASSSGSARKKARAGSHEDDE